MSDTLTAGPNGGFKKGKNVPLKNLDNKAKFICSDDTVYTHFDLMMKYAGKQSAFDYRVATPAELLDSGEAFDSNVMVVWSVNDNLLISHLSAKTVNNNLVLYGNVMTSYIYGITSVKDSYWTTSLD